MEAYQDKLETNSELCNALRFLIKDQAFQDEFIVTLLLEYIAKNTKLEV